MPIDVDQPSRMGALACPCGEKDITSETRLPHVDANVSVVSAYRGVRAALSKQQRRIGQRGKVVMVGRDIGTVVLPEADLKIYLDASAEQRAKRRFDEMSARGANVNYENILAKVIERDRIDSTRDVAPLKAAEDAVVVDSDKMNADEVFEQVLALCK
jgi:cytidylate kinase